MRELSYDGHLEWRHKYFCGLRYFRQRIVSLCNFCHGLFTLCGENDNSSGTPAFTAFILCIRTAVAERASNTFSGSATGLVIPLILTLWFQWGVPALPPRRQLGWIGDKWGPVCRSRIRPRLFCAGGGSLHRNRAPADLARSKS